MKWDLQESEIPCLDDKSSQLDIHGQHDHIEQTKGRIVNCINAVLSRFKSLTAITCWTG